MARMKKFPFIADVPYAVTFKKYERCHSKFVDDLIDFVISSEINQEPVLKNNSDTKSGFTADMGNLVCKLLSFSRRSNIFSCEINQFVKKCESETYKFVAENYVRDEIFDAGKHLKRRCPLTYFMYFTTICELYLKLADSKVNFLAAVVKKIATSVLDIYFLTFPGCEKLEFYAQKFLKIYDEAGYQC